VLALRAFNLESLMIGEHIKSKEPLVTQIRCGCAVCFTLISICPRGWQPLFTRVAATCKEQGAPRHTNTVRLCCLVTRFSNCPHGWQAVYIHIARVHQEQLAP
jgi:hypothetical protein